MRTAGLSMTALLASVMLILSASIGSAQSTLKVVMHAELNILDPIWTTAYITRNHGYMVYDTLLSTDANGEIKPQMLETYEVTSDNLVYTFTLRDGLAWHDGEPVTAEDCVASIKRWAAKDTMGQKLMSFVADFEVKDARTFLIKLKEPTGLVITALGKPSSNVPFMMPRRVAETNPNAQISDYTGSGPFIFQKDDWKSGDRAVYIRNTKYVPRAEAPSGLAGGKSAKVDRVEWRTYSDHQVAVNALLTGEVDLIEAPPHDLYPMLKSDSNIVLFNWNPLGNQYALRPNWLAKPFDNIKIRQALWHALNQEDLLKAVVGDPEYYRVCKPMFICGTPMASDKGMDGLLESNFKRSRELLQEAGYDGTPIVLMHSSDVQMLTNLAPVAKSLLEKGGFRVDLQSVDWQAVLSRRARKDAPSAGGWHLSFASWASADVQNPITAGFFNASCDKALFGWPCDEAMEKLRDRFARELDVRKQREIAEAVQVRATQITTHINLGQWYGIGAHRKSVSGWLTAPAPVFWNIEVN